MNLQQTPIQNIIDSIASDFVSRRPLNRAIVALSVTEAIASQAEDVPAYARWLLDKWQDGVPEGLIIKNRDYKWRVKRLYCLNVRRRHPASIEGVAPKDAEHSCGFCELDMR